jgi:hypothetical protein
VIGKPLSARFGEIDRIDGEVAIATLDPVLDARAREIVAVRAKGLLACVVVEADARVVKALSRIGLEMRPGGSAVFGLAGSDVARAFAFLRERERAWVQAPPVERETKIILFAAGYALVSVIADHGRKKIQVRP